MGLSFAAPLAGRDFIGFCTSDHKRNFNPRAPCGVRRSKKARAAPTPTFQSTHPLRGATFFYLLGVVGSIISIHAPLAGCDIPAVWIVIANQNFNPRTPCGVRRHCRRDGQRAAGHFNPRTPCGVRHCLRQCCNRRCSFQSTHPLRGATISSSFIAARSNISIHAPLAGCDGQHAQGLPARSISIHAPLAGCDARRSWTWRKTGRFQSTHPLRGATDRL